MRNHNQANSSTLVLAKGELCSLPRRAGPCDISCVSGQLWVTVAGRAEDYLLSGGDRLSLPAERRVVVEALRPSLARVEAQSADRVVFLRVMEGH